MTARWPAIGIGAEVPITTDSSLAYSRQCARTDRPVQWGMGGTSPIARAPRKLASDKARTILVADDEPAVRDLMALILEMEGYAVLKARHGEEALLFSREFTGKIHLLMTDYLMKPEMNGLDLARRMRRERPDIRVVFVSGFVGDDSLQPEIISSGARFLQKPFAPAALLEIVRQALGAPA